MTELILFLSTFASVFTLGLQSLNVNQGHYTAAFCTSLFIGGSQIILYKLAPSADASETLAYITGGPLGIITAMWIHRHTIGKKDTR